MKVYCVECEAKWDLDMDPPGCTQLEHVWVTEGDPDFPVDDDG